MAQQYPVNLQKDEVVIKLLRRHPVRVILEILVTAIIALILLAVLGWLYSTVSFFSTLWIILIALVILGAVITVFMDFYRYRHDLWMITNQRIVDSTRRSPFHHTLSTADLINVQDININRRGVLATLFKFGDVSCQTASQSKLFVFRGVASPEKVLELVDAQRDQARHSGR